MTPIAPGALRIANVFQSPGHVLEGLLPGRGGEAAVGLADERLGETVRMIRKVECVTALDAEEVLIDAALVAVVAAHDLHAVVGTAHTERGLAAVSAVGANGGDVIHLPRPRLVAVGSGSERAHRAGVDAHAALFAVEMVLAIGRDHAGDAAVLHAQRPDVHALAAHADATIAEDAARPVEEHDGRPLLFVAVLLDLDILRGRRSVLEGHVLQFALAAGIADRAVEWMVAEE